MRKTPPNPEEIRMFPVAYSYRRFSYGEQGSGDSLRRQFAAASKWSERNGIAVDWSLSLTDAAASGLRGITRSNPDQYAMARFLALIDSGRVQPGDYLLVENLDRLSREEEVPATHLLTSILMKGVIVVQLEPAELTLTAKSDAFAIMRAVLELSRAHGESKLKSVRVAEAWEERRRLAAEGKAAPPGRLPAWVAVGAGGRLQLVAERAATVRLIYQLAAGGKGRRIILRELESRGIAPFGDSEEVADQADETARTRTGRKRRTRSKSNSTYGSGRWTDAYVGKILSSRAAMGEFQQKTRDGLPVGEPISIPAAVSEEEWHAARAGCEERRHHKGRVSYDRVNLWSGLLTDALSGSPLWQSRQWVREEIQGKQAPRYVLQPRDGQAGRAVNLSFDVDSFDGAILAHLRELDARQALGQEGPDRTTVITGQLEQVRKLRDELKDTLRTLGKSPRAAVEALDDLEKEELRLEEDRRQEQQRAAHPLSEALGQAQALAECAKDPEKRLRLRSLLRRLIRQVYVLVVPRGRERLAAVQVIFATGKAREYLIWHRPRKAGRWGRVDASWKSRSLESERLQEIDLSRPTHVSALAAELRALDLADWR